MEAEDYVDLLVHTPNMITEEINASLTRDIVEGEIIKAIWTLHPDKAPGPNGFSISFYQTF